MPEPEAMCQCGHPGTAHALKTGVLGEITVGCGEPTCVCRHYRSTANARWERRYG